MKVESIQKSFLHPEEKWQKQRKSQGLNGELRIKITTFPGSATLTRFTYDRTILVSHSILYSFIK